MLASEQLPELFAKALGSATAASGAVMAAGGGDAVGTGLVVGSAGVLALMFRYWFAENKRNTAETWNHADEYRIERDYERQRAEHWHDRWVNLVQGRDDLDNVTPMPDLDEMKAAARHRVEPTKEPRRGRLKPN